MAQHQTDHLFIRVKANDRSVVCFNPHQVSSFQIIAKAMIKTKTPEGDKIIEADTVRLFFPAGTGLSYSVGIDIEQADFDYICATLLEFMYMNETEHKARSMAIEKHKMDDWNKISKENEGKLQEVPKEG